MPWTPCLLQIAVMMMMILLQVQALEESGIISSNDVSLGPPERSCLSVSGLARSQRRLCARQPGASAAALEGMRAAVDECRHQMRWHRWNCSALASKASNPHAAAILQRGYRESAFAFALASAGVVHSVARACAQGQLLACGCDPASYRAPPEGFAPPPPPPPPPAAHGGKQPAYRWKWGGCSHNMEYGISFSKLFLDSRETAGDLQSQVNLHNNEAGRLAVLSNMEVRCKCHGMSGSCQLRTCWRAAPPLRVVGRRLRQRYRGALMVDRGNLNGGAPRLKGRRNNRNRRRRERNKWRKSGLPHPIEPNAGPSRDVSSSLLYYERSPSFCERDPALDVPGTAGRRCARAASSPGTPGTCGALCCGRGHDLQRTRKHTRCRCRFHWCCTVECDTCERDEWVAVCK